MEKNSAMKRTFFERLEDVLCRAESEPEITYPDLRVASVLVPLTEGAGSVLVVLSKRTDIVPHHKGQVCFPGGSREPNDDSLLDTALREAEEEMGILRGDVKILGRMEAVPTMTKFIVTPYVCAVPVNYHFTPDTFEVDEVFTVPLGTFLDFSQYRMTETVFKGDPYPVFFIDVSDWTIWGATAKILRKFAELVKEGGLDGYL